MNRLNTLIDLGLVRNCTKRAVHQTHPAGHTLIIVNICQSMLIRADRIDPAGLSARPFLPDDRAVRALPDASAALDAKALIDMRFVVENPDGALRADLLARMSKTSLADIRDMDDVVRQALQANLITLISGGS